MNNLFMFNPFFPKLPVDYDIPPTIYAILNSYVNFDNPNPVKISNLANAGRAVIFDFDYPLTTNITKESFETMILNYFLMRRIGYETVTAFKIALSVKLNEIMPKYNKLFDSMQNWNLFSDGEVISRSESSSSSSNTGTNATSNGTGSNISDRRYSDTPQNELTNVQDGKYVTDYNYDTDTSSTTTTSTSTGTESSNGTRAETINRSNADKNDLYIRFSNEVNNVYTLIFKDLDPLFYGLV